MRQLSFQTEVHVHVHTLCVYIYLFLYVDQGSSVSSSSSKLKTLTYNEEDFEMMKSLLCLLVTLSSLPAALKVNTFN